jgi:hypothetical protein
MTEISDDYMAAVTDGKAVATARRSRHAVADGTGARIAHVASLRQELAW